MSKETQTAKAQQKKEKPKKADKMIKIKESEHKKLVEEASEYKEKYVRIMAEFDNARKRMDRDKQEFIKYANESLLADFLDILDSVDQSLFAAREKEQDESFIKGIELIRNNIFELLKKNDVKALETEKKLFDPHCHEVLMQENSDIVEEGFIIEEFQAGYKLGDKVIRTAKVKVSKGKEG